MMLHHYVSVDFEPSQKIDVVEGMVDSGQQLEHVGELFSANAYILRAEQVEESLSLGQSILPGKSLKEYFSSLAVNVS